MTHEDKIVWVIDPRKHGLRYVREAIVPAWIEHKDFNSKTRFTMCGDDTALVAYSVVGTGAEAETHRCWFVRQPSHFDGVDPYPLREVPHRIVAVDSIQANKPSCEYEEARDVDIREHRKAPLRLQRDFWDTWTRTHARHRIALPRSKVRQFFSRIGQRFQSIARRFTATKQKKR